MQNRSSASAWDFLTRRMYDRMLFTGAAIGSLPWIVRGDGGFHSTLLWWQSLLAGFPLGVVYVKYMSDVFGKYSFMLVSKVFPGGMKQLSLRNVSISLAMLWLGTFLYLSAVVLAFRVAFGVLTAGGFLALALGAVVVGAVFAFTHHQNHSSA